MHGVNFFTHSNVLKSLAFFIGQNLMKNEIIKIGEVAINQDNAGRYRLNDLHKASGGNPKDIPSEWLSNAKTKELIAELSTTGNPVLEQNQPVKIVNGGNKQGSYATKPLVYAYAMWISAKFHLHVIDVFDNSITASKEPLKLQAVAKEYKGALALAKLVGYKDNQAHLAANKATLKATGYNVHVEMNLQLEAPVQSRLITPTDMGLLINLSGIKVNQLLKEKGYQTDRRDSKNKIIWTPTDKGIKFATLLDTGKKNSDGTPVQQVKWCESIIKELGL